MASPYDRRKKNRRAELEELRNQATSRLERMGRLTKRPQPTAEDIRNMPKTTQRPQPTRGELERMRPTTSMPQTSRRPMPSGDDRPGTKPERNEMPRQSAPAPAQESAPKARARQMIDEARMEGERRVNRSGNERQGRSYTEERDGSRVYHRYANGERVMVDDGQRASMSETREADDVREAAEAPAKRDLARRFMTKVGGGGDRNEANLQEMERDMRNNPRQFERILRGVARQDVRRKRRRG